MFFYLMFVSILLLRKNDILKTCNKKKNFGKKIWRNALSLKSKKAQDIFGETFILAYYLQLSFVYKTMSQISFILFFREIKGFYQSSFGNEIDFRDVINVSPNILAKNSNFKNLRHGFVDESALTTTTYISSCHWKSLVPFWLWKKRPENVFLTLIVNYRKIMQKNKLCHSKQQ